MDGGMLYLCTGCGVSLTEVPAYVDGIAIASSLQYCQCTSGAGMYEYTPEEVEELIEYRDEIEDQDLNNREKTLFTYLGGTNAGKISSGFSPDSVEGDT